LLAFQYLLQLGRVFYGIRIFSQHLDTMDIFSHAKTVASIVNLGQILIMGKKLLFIYFNVQEEST
jgi:hypothetical protein